MAPRVFVTIVSPAVRATLLTTHALGINIEMEEIDLSNKEQFKPSFLKVDFKFIADISIAVTAVNQRRFFRDGWRGEWIKWPEEMGILLSEESDPIDGCLCSM